MPARRLLLALFSALAAGCGSSKPTESAAVPPTAPTVLRWYTTPGPLITGPGGKIMMVDPAGKEWLVAEVELPPSAKGAKGSEAAFRLRTPDGQTVRGAGTARTGANDWALGGEPAGPAAGADRLFVAFPVRQGQAGEFTLEFGDLSPAKLPADKKTAAPAP